MFQIIPYDDAQARGEVAGHGGGRNFKVADSNVETTTADLGLRRDEIHEARATLINALDRCLLLRYKANKGNATQARTTPNGSEDLHTG